MRKPLRSDKNELKKLVKLFSWNSEFPKLNRKRKDSFLKAKTRLGNLSGKTMCGCVCVCV